MQHRHMFSHWEINRIRFASRVLFQRPAHYVRLFAWSFCVFLRCLSFFACLFAFALYMSSLWPLCPSPLHLGSLLCGLWYLWSPPSLPVVSVWRPGPVILVLLVLPSKYLVASRDGLVALLYCWSVVVLCFLASFCSTAAKAFGPVWVFD